MRKHSTAFAMSVLLASVMPVQADDASHFDWHQWRYLPVQNGGRQEPLDSLARETLRGLANRARQADSESGQRLDATAWYMALLFDWPGWDRNAQPPRQQTHGSLQIPEPDKWDRVPLFRVDFLALRNALGLSKDQKYISPLEFSQSKIRVPDSGEDMQFLIWAATLAARQEEGLSEFADQALQVAQKFWVYQDLRSGRQLVLLPQLNSADQQWVSLSEIVHTKWDNTTDPSGRWRGVRRQFLAVRAAYRAGGVEQFNADSAAFISSIRQLGPQWGAYPTPGTIRLEVAYNVWTPFRLAWALMGLACVALLLAMGTRWRAFHTAGWLAFVGGVLAMTLGFAMRVAITQRAPVTNMYESVIYVALGTALFGMMFEVFCRRKDLLTAAAAVATVALMLADNCSTALDPSFHVLEPVLRSNFWLVTHVMTITLSYAALALAMAIGNVTLGHYLCDSRNQQNIGNLTHFTYRSIQVGVLLLVAGTVLGSAWADYCWGRFWSWDPKEVWALIALLGYLAVLHAHHTGRVRHFGMAALSVICFSLVIMAWYGVNFVLGVGLHHYGFGGGGQVQMCVAICVQLLFLFLSAMRYQRDRGTERKRRELAQQVVMVAANS